MILLIVVDGRFDLDRSAIPADRFCALGMGSAIGVGTEISIELDLELESLLVTGLVR